ncbi:glycoside hydrolase family 6 protein [Streptomyces johnsoniae]|uniref:Glucanase n=1 Tax=Streptomyces johnsoniae TaxID=3075532 RepID=A0ABU2RWM5_9ACTN|nr:glycoside hydrolase family 6 protein [Streptomyces sp. DSM 41886]MDT0441159.1 glycoside hydrolase family 6 protein [Streptomyces sp. DSM 41886]
MRTPRAAQPPDDRARRQRARRAPLVLAAGAALGGVFAWTALPTAQGASADLPGDAVFHNYPLQVHEWVEENAGDARQPLIAERIASQPQAVWFSNYEPGTVTQDAAEVTSAAAAAGEVPVLVSYMIPNRDCGGASAGGAPDFPSYLEWAEGFAAGLGSDPVAIILEPDSLALTTCLDDAERAERFSALAQAADTIHAANPEARVYFDAGHSAWHEPATMAGTLIEAGILESGDGIYSNVSNYRVTEEEVAFAEGVLAALGDDSLRAVIDTSRNGNGPDGAEWCDPPGRLVGENPTADTGNDLIDAYLWVKPPGELDGCAGPAGQFSPDMAYQLAGG